MGPIADRSITIRIGANVTGLVSSLKTAQQATRDFGEKTSGYITRNEQHINTLSNGFAAFGVAALALTGVAVKRFADFDQSMSNVAASTMESAGNMELLRAAALEAGQRTVYSATEAAGAIENLAKAGISTADILGGGLDGALDLAAAGGIEVADAAEIAASAMTQFGLKGRDVTRIADLLAAGAGKAQGGVGDLGMALNQAGLVASQMGLSVEETVGSLTAFASAGLVGSDAGTSFRAMLLRLANPTKESAELMTELGINAYDAGGQFVGMEALAGQLESRLGTLTQAERNQALAQIFGQDAIRTSAILYEEGAAGVREWTQAVDDQGYAAEVAATRLDNLNGDIEQLTGALETAFIEAGSGGNDMLRGLVQGVTDVVNAFSNLPDPIQNATLMLTGGAGLVALGLAGLGKLVIGINDAKTAMQGLGINARTAGIAVAGAVAALAAGALVLSAWAEEAARAEAMTELLESTLSDTAGITAETESAVRDLLAETRNIGMLKFDSAYTEAEKMGISFSTLTDYVLGSAGAIDQVRAASDEYIEGSSTWEHLIQSREGAVANLTYTLDTMAESLTEAQRAELQKIQADAEAGVSTDELTAATEDATLAIEDQTTALNALITAQADAAGVVLSQRDAERALQEAIAGATTALETNGATLDITTEKGRANQTALDDIASSTWDLITSMEANGATQEQVQAQMGASRDAFIRAAEAMGMGTAEANALADELNLIPTNVNVDVNVDVETASAQAQFNQFLERNRGRSIRIQSIIESGGNTGGGFASGGWTGNLSTSAVAGVVHGQEFVVKAGPAAMYRPLLEAINAGVRGYKSGGFVAPTTQHVAPPSTSMPVAAPVVYVQNPFTGEYVRAEIATVAGEVVTGRYTPLHAGRSTW